MKQCINCGLKLDNNTVFCPRCGFDNRQNNANGNNNRKKLLIVLFSLIGVLIISGGVLVFILMTHGKSEAKTFDFDCAAYTEQMNALLGNENGLDNTKWVENEEKDKFRYSGKDYAIELTTEKDSQKVKQIAISPTSVETALKISAASIMVADDSVTQEDALNDLVALKSGSLPKIVHNTAAITYDKDNDSFVIKHKTDDDEQTETVPKGTSSRMTPSTAATEPAIALPNTEPSTVAPTTVEETTVANDGWKQAYIDFINSNSDMKNYGKFALIEVDDDSIPEIYCAGNFHMAGSMFICYDGSKAVNQKLSSEFSYKPHGGMISTGDMFSGVNVFAIYSYSGAKLDSVVSGRDTEGTGQTPQYYINGENTTKENYEAKKNNYSDINTSPSPTYSKDEIIDEILAY